MNISFKKALRKTTIEVDSEFLNSIWDKMIEETNEKLVPPIFDEFIISVIFKNKIYDDMKSCVLEEQILPLELDEKQVDFYINKAIKDMLNEIRYDTTDIYYVKYISATKLVIIYFDGLQHKKRINVEIEYKCNDIIDNVVDDVSCNIEISYFDKSFFVENTENIISYIFQVVRVVSHYMLTYNPTVEYKEIKTSELQRKKDKEGNYCKNFNKGYSQYIRLKSKITKYVVDFENDKKNQQLMKERKYVKRSWYVRGYYQHFGKEKVLKYIPPRINSRHNLKQTKEKPTASKYILK